MQVWISEDTGRDCTALLQMLAKKPQMSQSCCAQDTRSRAVHQPSQPATKVSVWIRGLQLFLQHT